MNDPENPGKKNPQFRRLQDIKKQTRIQSSQYIDNETQGTNAGKSNNALAQEIKSRLALSSVNVSQSQIPSQQLLNEINKEPKPKRPSKNKQQTSIFLEKDPKELNLGQIQRLQQQNLEDKLRQVQGITERTEKQEHSIDKNINQQTNNNNIGKRMTLSSISNNGKIPVKKPQKSQNFDSFYGINQEKSIAISQSSINIGKKQNQKNIVPYSQLQRYFHIIEQEVIQELNNPFDNHISIIDKLKHFKKVEKQNQQLQQKVDLLKKIEGNNPQNNSLKQDKYSQLKNSWDKELQYQQLAQRDTLISNQSSQISQSNFRLPKIQ